MRAPLASSLAIALLAAAASVVRAQPEPTPAPPDGSQLYTANCVACHQPDGKGLPNMAPALTNNAVVSGDPAVLIQILMKGPAAVLPADRPKFGASTMDPYYYKLTDEEMVAVLTYVRQTFGKGDKLALVDLKDVTAARAKVDAENAAN